MLDLVLLITAFVGMNATDHAERALETAKEALVMQRQFVGPLKGVSWIDDSGDMKTLAYPVIFEPFSACDSEADCKQALKDLCRTVDSELTRGSAKITQRPDGGKLCSGECDSGAVPFVECASPSFMVPDRRIEPWPGNPLG